MVKISNWSPYIFMLVLKVGFGLYKIHAYINQPMPCQNSAFHLKLIGTSSTDDTRVKVPSFQEVTFFLTI